MARERKRVGAKWCGQRRLLRLAPAASTYLLLLRAAALAARILKATPLTLAKEFNYKLAKSNTEKFI